MPKKKKVCTHEMTVDRMEEDHMPNNNVIMIIHLRCINCNVKVGCPVTTSEGLADFKKVWREFGKFYEV